MGYRNYSTANGFIVDKLGNGDFTTIGAALTAAVSGDTIFIRPGTYTENPALKAGVNLVAYATSGIAITTSSSTPGNVIINGECTYSSVGTVSITGICLQTNSNFCLSVTGANSSIVNLNNCFINASNNTAINFSSSVSTSSINLYTCNGNIGTTGIALFSDSAAGSMSFWYGTYTNSGASVTANTCSGSGSVYFEHVYLQNGITCSSTGAIQSLYSNFTMAGSQTAITYSGSSSVTGNLHTFSTFATGTASCISIGGSAGCALYNCFVGSSNANTIAGTGTLEFTNLSCNSVANLASGLTLTLSAMNNYISAGGIGTAGQALLSGGPSAPMSWGTPSGLIVQQVRNTKSAAQTITNNLASITTTPTTSTGSSIVQVTITPTNSAHILLIEAVMNATSAGNNYGCYIIQNAAGNSIATSWTYGAAADEPNSAKIQAYITAGGTSAITFDLYGFSVGTDTYVNANTSATQLGGGTTVSSLTVTEYTS